VGIKVLYADDEPRYLRLVKMFLEAEGFSVVTAESGRAALKALGAHPDTRLVILDVLMDGLDGYKTCEAIRGFSKVPILMLTALGDERHEVRGIKVGADDYVAKPFSKDRLVTRVRALLRRAGTDAFAAWEARGIVLEPEARTVTAAGARVDLTLREFELLRYLMERRGAVCPRERILDAVWGSLYDGDPRTLDTHVKSLRRKLGSSADAIATSRGVGYTFLGGDA
jgi:two-component system alkaline phosphatase synthesis response regulator PhoP